MSAKFSQTYLDKNATLDTWVILKADSPNLFIGKVFVKNKRFEVFDYRESEDSNDVVSGTVSEPEVDMFNAVVKELTEFLPSVWGVDSETIKNNPKRSLDAMGYLIYKVC